MIDVQQRLSLSSDTSPTFYSLPMLEAQGIGAIARLPVSLRILLESVVRNRDGRRIRDEDVEALARWQPNAERTAEIPFVVGRVLSRILPACHCWSILPRCVRLWPDEVQT